MEIKILKINIITYSKKKNFFLKMIFLLKSII